MFSELFRRLWYLLHRRRIERELQQEMEAHREMMAKPRRFGNTLRLREQSRDVWGWNWFDDSWRDLRSAASSLRRTPGFAIGAVLILSFGLGLNLGVFQIMNVGVFRPLPVRDVDSLMRLRWNSRDGRSRNVPQAAVSIIRENSLVLSAVLTSLPGMILWGDGDQHIRTLFVSANWFEELGYSAAIGRVFQVGIDEAPDAPPVVIVSHRFWERQLASNPNIVGQTVRLNNRKAILIGVAPANFPGLRYDTTDVWIPDTQFEYFNSGIHFANSWLEGTTLYARLRPGITPAVAKQSLRTVFSELTAQRPDLFQLSDWFDPATGKDGFRTLEEKQHDLLPWVSVGAVGMLILVIACATLGNLVLSRSLSKIRELGIRIALGSGRWRVVRHLLAESFLLAFLGLAGAAIVGYWGLEVLTSLQAVPRFPVAAVDWRLVSMGLAMNQYDETLSDRRNFAVAVNALSCLTMLLASLGIFSVVSYGITLRRKEIGIRMALGGQGVSIIRLLLRQVAGTVIVSSGVGVALGFVVIKTIEIQNPNSSTLIALDPVLLASVAMTILLCVVVATIVPVCRALRIDILQALRCE